MKIDKVLDPNFKTGETNGKPWVLMQVLVGDNVATIFAPAAEGDEVTLTFDPKYKSYKAQKVGKPAGKSFTADPKKLEQEFKLEVARNQSIQRQVAFKGVIDLMVSGKIGVDALDVWFDLAMDKLANQWHATKNIVVDSGDFAKINPDDFVPDDIDEGAGYEYS